MRETERVRENKKRDRKGKRERKKKSGSTGTIVKKR